VRQNAAYFAARRLSQQRLCACGKHDLDTRIDNNKEVSFFSLTLRLASVMLLLLLSLLLGCSSDSGGNEVCILQPELEMHGKA